MYSFDSSVGRAEDCRVRVAILRSLVRIRLEGCSFFSFFLAGVVWQMVQGFSGHFGWNGKRGIRLRNSIFFRKFSLEWAVSLDFITENSDFSWQMVSTPYVVQLFLRTEAVNTVAFFYYARKRKWTCVKLPDRSIPTGRFAQMLNLST